MRCYITIPREDSVINPIWSYFFGPPTEKKDMVELLRSLPVFEGLSTNELLVVDRMLHQRRYSVHEVVFEEDMPGAGLYIIKEGEIVIKKHIEGGEDVVLAVVKERSFFGEMALLEEMPRSAGAFAQKESILLALSKPDLESLNDRNPKLTLKIVNNIAALMCKRLVKANENLELLQNKINVLTAQNQRGT
jgi:CRP/FNR family cyclic AMP-dependent transcriptional regulator